MSLSNKNPSKNGLIDIRNGKVYSCHVKADPSKDENWVLVKRPSKKLLDELAHLVNELGFEEDPLVEKKEE